MNYYQEITLLPDPEISVGFLWQQVYQQVHIALVDNKTPENTSNIAVAFPLYGKARFPLGNKLRLFAKDKAQLEQLDINQWLNRLQDYVHIKTIQPVPKEVTYASYSRRHIKSKARINQDMHEKAQLDSKRLNKPFDECLAERRKTKPQPITGVPFISLYSQETKKRSPDDQARFPLYIEMKELAEKREGIFDCYGLNAKINGKEAPATVPNF